MFVVCHNFLLLTFVEQQRVCVVEDIFESYEIGIKLIERIATWPAVIKQILVVLPMRHTVELRWLEHLWDHEMSSRQG